MEVLYRRCCGLDVHKETVVACLRLVSDGKVAIEVRTFETTTASLIALSEWLAQNGCTHIAMEATGIYWKPVWHILADGEFQLVLANSAHVKNVPGRKTDVNDATWLAGTVGSRSDPGELRARYPDARAAHLAGAKDAGRCQHQIGLGDHGRHGHERSGDDRGAHCGRERSHQAGQPCQLSVESITAEPARSSSRSRN